MGTDYIQHARGLVSEVLAERMTREDAIHHIQQYTETYTAVQATMLFHDAVIQQRRGRHEEGE